MGWFKKKEAVELDDETILGGETTSGLTPLTNEQIQAMVRTYYEELEPGFWGEIKEQASALAASQNSTEDQLLSSILSTSPFYDSLVVLDSIVVGFMGSNEYYAEAEARRVSGEHYGKTLGTGRPTYAEYPEILTIGKALKAQLSVKNNMSNKERDKIVQNIMIQTIVVHHEANDKGDSGELTSAIWQAFSRVAIINIIAFDVKKGLGKSPLAFADYLKNLSYFADLLIILYYEAGREKDPRVKEFLGIEIIVEEE